MWRDRPSVGTLALLPGTALAGFGQGLQLPVLFRIVLSDIPAERAGVGSGVLVTAQQSTLALGVATLDSLFLTLSGTGTAHMGHALAVTLLTQLALVVVTGVLALRLPRRMS